MKDQNRFTGQIGEQRAQDYLISHNFTIRETNATSRWGELDIIAQKGNKIHFIEVKTRISTRQGLPYEAVRVPKVSHLSRSIQHYILTHRLNSYKFQLDVISINLDSSYNVLNLRYYENIPVREIF